MLSVLSKSLKLQGDICLIVAPFAIALQKFLEEP